MNSTRPFLPDDATLIRILSKARHIAVVGFSDNPSRPSHQIARYLASQGYRVTGVNPLLVPVRIGADDTSASPSSPPSSPSSPSSSSFSSPSSSSASQSAEGPGNASSTTIVAGIPVVASLKDAHSLAPVDIVDVFRKSSEVAPVVDEALAIGSPVVWLQDGVIDPVSARRATDAGATVVMDTCTLREHRRLM